MEWESRFELGVPLIDDQHKELFARLTALEHSMESGDPGEIARMLEFLGHYVVEHFRGEEAEMRAAQYPALEAHLVAHRHLIEAFGLLQAEFRLSGSAPWLAVHIRAVVSEWLQVHILKMDQAFGRFLLEKGRLATG